MTATPWTVCLGEDAAGQWVWKDLSRAPHILLCGTSGSGKSVGVNALVAGLVAAGTPQDTQITILDPKRVEFGIWRPAAHVAAVVTDRDAMRGAVESVVQEMDRRYVAMERGGVVDVEAWHGTSRQLPRLFLVCDEVADLTMVGRDKASKDRAGAILGALTRLAQLGRAAGVHLILATQRPAADTLPGNLRANLGTRWAFRVRTRGESRIALDAPGAESLGSTPGTSLLSWRGATGTFVQGAYCGRDEIAGVVALAVETYGARRGLVGPVRGMGGLGARTHSLVPQWAVGVLAVAGGFYAAFTF